MFHFIYKNRSTCAVTAMPRFS